MSDEEKEALEWLENDVKKTKELRDKWHMYMVSNKNEILLNLIKKQNDIIDMMAGKILLMRGVTEFKDKPASREDIKQYFLNKQEEN